ncbi:hypothetical protein QJQ45_011961 [Haematococcus lacustris]|nr:hypothetical protein QJQ45_011961 [Haematococcus lacustris]
MLPMVGVRARHFVIDDRVLHGVLTDLGMTTLTRPQLEADSLPHWHRFIQYSELQNSGWDFARRVETDGISISVYFVRNQVVKEPGEPPCIGRASGSGQQDQEQGQGQAMMEVIGERRQVIKAAFRGLVEAARPDFNPAEVDAAVAEVNNRMTMGSMRPGSGHVPVHAAAVLPRPAHSRVPSSRSSPRPPPPPDPACPPFAHPRLATRSSPRTAAAPAQLPPPMQLNIWDPQLLAQIKDAMELLTNASVLEHLMRGPHHRGIRLLPGEVAVFEQPSSAWPVAKLQELDGVHLRGDTNSLNANATKIITSIQEYYRHPQRFISWWCKAVGVVEGGFSRAMKKHFPQLVLGRLDYSLPDRKHKWRLPPNRVLRQPRGLADTPCPCPFTMLPMVEVRARHFVIDDRVLHGLLTDLGMIDLTRLQFEAASLPHWQRFIQYNQLQNCQVLRQWEWELSKGQLKHDSGLIKAKQDTARWSAAIQPQLQQLTAATLAGTTLDGLHAHILALKATWDPLWEEYLKPRWRRQRLGLHHAQERVIEAFCKKRIGEGKQRPLELCSYEGQMALPPIGKEYQQGYKRVTDRLPKDILHPHTLVPKPTRTTRTSHQQPPVKPDAHAWQPAPPLLAQLKESLCWCLAFDAACELLCRLWGPSGQQPGALLPLSLLLCMTQWLQFAMGFSVVCLVVNLAHRVAQLLQLPLPKALREGRLLLPPRAMKDVLLSTSLADMWGQKWHQYFRSDHYNLAQRPTQAALDWAGSRLGTGVTASPHWRNIRRAVTVMAVFVFNGVIHEYMNWAGLGISDGMHLAFFTVHGLGLLLEEKLVAPGKASSAFSAAARRAVLAPPWGRWLDRDTNPCLKFQRIGESKQRPLELCSWKDLEALPPVGKEYQQGYKRRIGESRWRPLELCYWPDQGALPAKGKEYPGLGYKRVRDKPPKAQEQQQQPAEAQ